MQLIDCQQPLKKRHTKKKNLTSKHWEDPLTFHLETSHSILESHIIKYQNIFEELNVTA